MIYLRSVLIGIVTGVVAAVLWVIAALIVPVFLPFLLSRLVNDSGGLGASSGYVESGSVMLVLIAGFILGFGWSMRRAHRRMTRAGL